jgi:serine/threonine-protein kinase
MSTDSSINRLVEQILDTECAPEDACHERPELLWEVRQRLDKIRRVEAHVEAMFPPSAPSARRAQVLPGDKLPEIPGYRIEGIVGRGGMGVVYRARHLKLNRAIALKMLLSGAYAGPTERARFAREAEAVAALTHPNVVQVHDVGDFDGRPYFTMELVEGGSLAQKLAGTPMPAQRAAELMATLSDAVQAAHRAGIIHRDLKPGNILLSADGAAKITDFGLARQGDEPGLTLSGTRVGTPSYMAPEQAVGGPAAVGPAADIYSLGAIVYEMLTGRPPFRAETASETQRQLVTEEPVPPSRLNAKVPRDLETICLKCLQKEPSRRYASASDLAEDIRRYLRGEPIAARPAGLLERTAKWIRRRPAVASALAAILVASLVVVAAIVLLAIRRADLRHAVEADLKDMSRFQAQARWPEARGALDRALARLGGGDPGDLRDRLRLAGHDLELVEQLDAIRLSRATRGQTAIYRQRAAGRYEQTFSQAGLAAPGNTPESVAERISASAVRSALLAALDDWALCVDDEPRRAWLLDIARRTDPDPSGWRDRIRDSASWSDRDALVKLADEVPIQRDAISLLIALGERLRTSGADATAFLRRVQIAQPDDFWTNLALGNALLQRAPEDAAGYYRAALASRPGAAVGYCAVGDALRLQNSLEEAIYYYQQAIQRDPDLARAHTNLGLTLQKQGKLNEAVTCYQASLRLDANYVWSYYNLADTLRGLRRFDEALEQYKKAQTLEPQNLQVVRGIRDMCVRQGQVAEVLEEWRKAIDANPAEHDTWFGFAELCLFAGRREQYQRTRAALLNRFGADTDPLVTEKVARACLLIPGSTDELRAADSLADRALAGKGSVQEWIHPYFWFAKGLSEYRHGHFDQAIAIMQEHASTVMGPSPKLITAMALHRQGKPEAAREMLDLAIKSADWSIPEADSRDVWISHILRREAETTLDANASSSRPAE